VCDLEASRMGRLWHALGAAPQNKMLNTKGRIPEVWNIKFEHLLKKILTVGAYGMRCNLSDSFRSNLTVHLI
jgi:hypothetical protein